MTDNMNTRGLSYNQRRPLAMNKRNNQNYQKYMDKMGEALNKNIEKNIFPYWRNHQSLKGILHIEIILIQVGVL